MSQKGDYINIVNFLWLSSMYKVVLFGGCSSRVMGGLLRKTAENTCCCSYCCRSSENGDLAWTAKAQVENVLPQERYQLVVEICVVYHVLRRCTRGDNGVYLHRAGPGAMGHRRCLKGYDRASKWYSKKQRGTALGSETISLVSCHMTYNPLQADSPES